jgi:hypothetical protein
MFTRVRARLSYANVIASLALFLAFTGGAYALSIPNNSVGTKQLKKKAVTTSKIASGAVTHGKLAGDAVSGSRVKNDSLTGADIKESTLAKVPSAAAADAATNATNATALGGKAAGSYASNVVVRTKALIDLANNDRVGATGDGGTNDGTVMCAAGERAVGGGMKIQAAGVDQAIASSRPVIDASGGTPADGATPLGWRSVAVDSGSVAGNNPTTVSAYAICVS